ncbi:MAG: PqqD family protein [Terracidiphilus sp.]
MQVERANLSNLVINPLPDGSKVIIDSENETVFALNATSGAAWDACNCTTTLSKIAEDMQRTLDPGITEEIAEAAILQLQERKLVTVSGHSSNISRRAAIGKLGVVALPLIVSLTMAQQRAHAQNANSGGGGSID